MKTSQGFQFSHFRFAVRLPDSETWNTAAQGPCDVQTPEIWIQHFKSSRDAKEEGGVVRMSEEEKSKRERKKKLSRRKRVKGVRKIKMEREDRDYKSNEGGRSR